MEWKHFIKYRFYDYIDRITWRELKLGLGKKDISIIEEFIYKNINKQYFISIERLMIMRSVVHKPTEKEEKEVEKQGFFCSELVAALYKKLGLVDPEKSTSQYYPGTFSKVLPLLRGKLGDLVTIVFENELMAHRLF